MEIKEFQLSHEQHMKDYPKGYEIIFDEPKKIEIFWNKSEDLENGIPNGVIHQAKVEEDEVIEIHLWKEGFFPYEWRIAFEGEESGRDIPAKAISGWRFI